MVIYGIVFVAVRLYRGLISNTDWPKMSLTVQFTEVLSILCCTKRIIFPLLSFPIQILIFQFVL